MPQTLRTTFSFKPHTTARHALVPVTSHAAYQSIEGLLAAMRQFMAKAKTDLRQPRQQAVDRILREAAMLH